nr:hypothetical protein [Tanacetum cinerariifolium]
MHFHIIVKDNRCMDMTIDQQVALDEALVPHASRLRIAFLVIADVTEIYMKEFWATATVHHHLIRFKMNNKKRIVNLEYFREMLHICLRIPNQTFVELPFEEEILAFLRYLRHTYKEYYAITLGATPPKTKASVRKTQSSFETTMPPPMAAGTRLSISAKGKQPAKSSMQKLSTHDEEAKDKKSFDHIVQTPSQVEKSDNESNADESRGMNVGGEKGPDAENYDKELYRDININLESHNVQMTDVHTTQMESNKSIHRLEEQRNLYKALVDAYECDKIILDTYGDTVTLKRRRDDADKMKNPPLDQTGGPRE